MSNRRWYLLAAVAVLGLLGLFGGSAAITGSGQILGAGLFVACAFLGFIVVKQHFDGAPESALLDILPTDARTALWMVGIMGVLALSGLFIATHADPYVSTFGLSLTGVCALFAFAGLKRYFDALDRSRKRKTP